MLTLPIKKKWFNMNEQNYFKCPSCGGELAILDDYFPKQTYCADCGQSVRLEQIRLNMHDTVKSISTIKNFMANASRTTCNEFLYEALQDAVGSMEKEIPKPPIDDTAFGSCPNCHSEFNSELVNEYDMKYCLYCGQALETGG